MTFEVVSTKSLQAESLRLFMQALGYVPARANGGFYTDNPFMAAHQQVSTATAIKLHNKGRTGWQRHRVEGSDQVWYRPKGLNVSILLSEYGLNVVLTAKLVKEVKFQASRKAPNGLVFPRDPLANLIKPNDRRYLSSFGIA